MSVSMTMADIDSINHIGMAVRDLSRASHCFEAMGFQLTPWSAHAGAWKPGEPVKPLGAGNRCVMFARNYLEILASEHADQPSPRIAGYLQHHQGAHIICFNSEAVEAVDARLVAAGVATSGAIPLQRDIDTPEGVRTARFQRVQFAPGDSPEGYIQAARHLTPQYIYQPQYIRHPNGCTELRDTLLVTDDLAHFVAKYQRYTGQPAQQQDGAMVFHLPGFSRLSLIPLSKVSNWLPGSLLPPLPGVAAVSFHCPDLQAQRQRLLHAGFTVLPVGERLLVPAEEACGLAILFEQ